MIASRPLVCAMRHRIVRNDPVGCTGEVHPSLTSLPQPRLEQSPRGFFAAEAGAIFAPRRPVGNLFKALGATPEPDGQCGFGSALP